MQSQTCVDHLLPIGVVQKEINLVNKEGAGDFEAQYIPIGAPCLTLAFPRMRQRENS